MSATTYMRKPSCNEQCTSGSIVPVAITHSLWIYSLPHPLGQWYGTNFTAGLQTVSGCIPLLGYCNIIVSQ